MRGGSSVSMSAGKADLQKKKTRIPILNSPEMFVNVDLGQSAFTNIQI